MPIISNYPFDRNVQDNDAWIGTDASNMATKQFTAKDVADYLNIKGKISISAQMVFKYEADATKAVSGDFTNVVGGTTFTNISSVYISFKDKSDQATNQFLTYLIGSGLLISEQNAIDNFGHYTIVDYVQDTSNPQWYTLTLSNIGGNGVLEDQKYYNFATFNIAGGGGSGSTFIFQQAVSSVEWNIQHDLNKYPSVTTVDNGLTQIHPKVEYTNSNNIKLTFTSEKPNYAGEQGYAYLN